METRVGEESLNSSQPLKANQRQGIVANTQMNIILTLCLRPLPHSAAGNYTKLIMLILCKSLVLLFSAHTGKMHVSLAEALEVRGGPLLEEEVWAVLSQSAESLQELFHKGNAGVGAKTWIVFNGMLDKVGSASIGSDC